MLMKSLAFTVLVLVFAALVWAQGGGRRQQGFTDCDLDLRPQSRPEVQVYWTPVPNGVQYQIWSTQDDKVRLGYPDGTHEISLKKGFPNTVTFTYDDVNRKVTIATCNVADVRNCPVEGPHDIPVIGSYNPILPIVEPTEQEAEPGPGNKERVLVTGGRYGLEFSFTLAIPK